MPGGCLVHIPTTCSVRIFILIRKILYLVGELIEEVVPEPVERVVPELVEGRCHPIPLLARAHFAAPINPIAANFYRHAGPLALGALPGGW